MSISTNDESNKIMISMELNDVTKWNKCEIRSFEEMIDKLTPEEIEVLSNVKNPIIECHSEICDAGGHCDLGKREIKFNMILKYPYDHCGDSLLQLQRNLQGQISSIHDIYFYHNDKGTGIKAIADRRELNLWLKKMNISTTLIDDKDNAIIVISEDSEVMKVLQLV